MGLFSTPQLGLLPSGLGDADNPWAQDARQEAHMRACIRQQEAMTARDMSNPYAPVPPGIAPMKPVTVSREAEKLMEKVNTYFDYSTREYVETRRIPKEEMEDKETWPKKDIVGVDWAKGDSWKAIWGHIEERKEDLCLCTKNLWS